MKKLRLLMLVGATLSLCNCMSVIGTQGAIREWGRYQNGAVKVGKAAGDQDDAYHKGQRHYDTFTYSGESSSASPEGFGS